MQKRFDTIVTHEKPHFDEIFAIWLLKKFGRKKFPGIDAAKIKYWTDSLTPADDYEKDGILLIGIGGGRFDEHPTVGNERKKGECSATLVAKTLNIEIENDPALEKILAFTVNNDLNGTGSPFDIAYIAKLMHQQYPDNPEKVMEWVAQGIEAKYQEQLQFITTTREEFERVASVEEVIGPHGKKYKMITVISDNPQMNKFARSSHGGRAHIIIQKHSSGNVQIFSDKRAGLTFYDVIQMLRVAEQEAKGNMITTDWKQLSSEGKVDGAEEWFFHKSGQMILNGSLTARKVPPTKIPLERIQEIVRIGVNPDCFESNRASYCAKGICTSSKNNPCPWYCYGLHRCRKVRFEQRR